METKSGADTQQCPDGRCQLQRQRRHAREEWLSQWSYMWTQRQSPEWKPRRASVATCQQQQHFAAQHYYSYELAHQFGSTTSASIKELINRDQLQYQEWQQQQQQQQIANKTATATTYCTHIKVNQTDDENNEGKTEENCNDDNNSQENLDQKEEHEKREYEPIVSMTNTTAVVPQTDNCHSCDKTCFRSMVVSKSANRSHPDGDCGGNSSACSCTSSSSQSCASQAQRRGSSAIEVTNETGRAVSKLNRSTLDLYLCSYKRTTNDSVTCCSESAPITASFNGPASQVNEEFPGVAVSEKLQLQNKQRKYLIFSMALKQMIAERNLTLSENGHRMTAVGQDCCYCNCRSRSCSFGLVRSPGRVVAASTAASQTLNDTEEHQQQVATSGSRMVLSTSRSMLIGKLQADRATANTTSGSYKKTSGQSEKRASMIQRKINTIDKDQKQIKQLQTIKPQAKRSASASGEVNYRINDMRQLLINNESANYNESNLNEEQWRDQHSPADSCEIGQDTDEEESESQSMGARDLPTNFASASAQRNDVTKRSCSAHSKASNISEDLDTLDTCDLNLEALIIESWLDDHPSFTHDYFMRKASHQLIDDWLIAHAKVSNTNLSSQLDLHSASKMSRPISQQSLNSPLRGPLWRVPDSMKSNESTGEARSTQPSFVFARSARSKSQSGGGMGGGYRQGAVTPIRKISATDFESRTGSSFLRPILSTTPDGRLTFLSQPLPPNAGETALQGKQHDSDQSKVDQNQNVGDITETGVASNNLEAYNVSNDDIDEDELRPGKGEVKLIFELVKNICNDLDIRTLLHKILKNIAVLINADKSSLFLVCGEPNDPNRHLVSQLFNVDQDSSEADELDDCITIPWGTGIVGYVAESGESLNIANCYEDPRFTNAIDQRTGYVTKHMLCAPIFDNRNEIVGVAQVINKRDGNPFSRSDEIKFKRYLQFCGIGLRNAQSYEHCQLENRRNQVLLDLARMVFEEQSTIEQVVYRIMLHTQSLLECQRCQVLLIDDGSDDLDQLLKLPNSATSTWQRFVPTQPGRTSSSSRPPEWRPQCPTEASEVRMAQDNPSEVRDSLETNNDIKQQLPSTKLFSLVFDLECDGNDPVLHSSKGSEETAKLSPSLNQKKNRRFPINIGITGYVAMTGETLNIEDAHKHERFDPSVDEGSDFKHKSILCMPIRNGQRQIIGVSQLINKKNGRPFNKNDEDLFEAFAIFCGLGIHNTLMYERVLKIMAKQKVTFEVLSYHATAPLEEAKKLSLEQIPSCFALNLASLKFNDFSLDDQYMLKSCLRFFLDLDLMRRFQIDQLVFCNWILSVQKNYRKVTYHPIVGGSGLKSTPVRYHNWRHAFNVSQMMFAILVNTQICQALGELETLGLLIACLCHDLDHRGTNNSFQIKSASPLAELYSTSTMEHHHFDQCVMILNSQGNQILANLSPSEYSRVIVLLEEAILATDLANYFQKRDLFFKLVNSNKFDWQNDPEHRSLLRCMLMTACDVAAITKPWPVQKVVADLVMSEFYQQGDIEKSELNIEPIDMMNRDKMSKLPEMQISFIDTICAPIYTAFAKLFPKELTPLLDGCLANRNLWTEMANNNVQSDLPLASYLNVESSESSTILPTNNTSKSEIDIHRFHQRIGDKSKEQKTSLGVHNSEVSLPFDDSNKPNDVRPLSTCKCYISKIDYQRKSV